MTQDFQFEQSLYSRYEFYKEQAIQNRLIKHADIERMLLKHSESKLFQIFNVGSSVENRSLYLVKAGSGKTKIFLWSQMHGDEPTATAAIFDVLNFMSSDDEYNDFRNYLLKNLEIYFLPMVNPDGAERFQRRNALGIDLNRDARRLESPEAKILKSVFDSIKADFGFNLHDQNKYYSVGKSFCSAAISFLAPPPDKQNTVSPNREAAMKLIGEMFLAANSFIPGHIAKYSDDYEPRAFGDNFQKLGTSTILIESGGWNSDTDRQFIRKLNFIILLAAFKSIADRSFINIDTSIYENLPFNDERLSDFIFRNISVQLNNKSIITDLAIQSEEKYIKSDNKIVTDYFISDIGDLSVFSSYNDFDFTGYEFQLGKEIIIGKMPSEELDYLDLLSKRITAVIINSDSTKFKINSSYPIRFLTTESSSSRKFGIHEPAEFIILKDARVCFAFVNGKLFDLNNDFWLTK